MKGILVRLIRHVKYQFLGMTGASGNSIEDSLPAVWWPRLAGTEEISLTSEHIRHVNTNRELHLKVVLKPSFAMSHFRVEVRDFLLAYIRLMTDTD